MRISTDSEITLDVSDSHSLIFMNMIFKGIFC